MLSIFLWKISIISTFSGSSEEIRLKNKLHVYIFRIFQGGGQEKNLGRYAVFFQNAQKNHHPPYIFQFHGFFPWFFWHPPLLCPKKITQKPPKITTHHIFSNFMDFFHDFFDTLPFLKKKKILWWSAFEITVVNLFVMSFGK